MRRFRWLLVFAVFALIAAACSSDSDDETTTTTAAASTETTVAGATETTAAAATETTAAAAAADLSGTEVAVFGAPTGDEAVAFTNTFNKWNETTGAEATYEGSDDMEAQLRIRVEGNNAPDIALLPQPGSICGFADDGKLVSLEDMGFDIAALEAAHGAFFISLGECSDGQHYAIPTNTNMKSIVWYNKPAFEAGGYAVPSTWDELVALSQQVADDGITPWCIGFGSDAATGWPGTDWLEDIMIRTVGADGYLAWVKGELPFSSPEVQAAFDTFGEIMFTDGYVLGGPDQVAAIDFRDAVTPMFGDPPNCMFHRQANFITNFFPEGMAAGTDADFFPFPAIDPAYTDSVMGAGEMAVVFEGRPEVAQLLADFSGPTWQCVHASVVGDPELGGNDVPGVERISANANTPIECYETDTIKTLATAIAAALGSNGFAFDASDLMPPEVGTGSFWTGMVDWSRGSSAADVGATIDASWPSG